MLMEDKSASKDRPVSVMCLCFLSVTPFCWEAWGHEIQWMMPEPFPNCYFLTTMIRFTNGEIIHVIYEMSIGAIVNKRGLFLTRIIFFCSHCSKLWGRMSTLIGEIHSIKAIQSLMSTFATNLIWGTKFRIKTRTWQFVGLEAIILVSWLVWFECYLLGWPFCYRGI